MKLKILGAAGEVTGSNYLVRTNETNVLVDCGFHQGRDEKGAEDEEFEFVPSDIDVVLLTHAHIDHSGRIPLLVKKGFAGPVYMTAATAELCAVLWRDTMKIMREEAQWKSRKNERKGLAPITPLFDEHDVEHAIAKIKTVGYDKIVDIASGVRARYREAGHILGSASIEVWLEEEGKQVKIVFSGDLGPQHSVLEPPPAVIEEADFVVIESTYGDRFHRTLEETREEFRQAVTDAVKDRGKILVPTFVVDRAQRVLYEFFLMQRDRPEMKFPPIYFDSPMGLLATQLYGKYLDRLSPELRGHIESGQDPFLPKGTRYVKTPEESREINNDPFSVVMAGSGMCNGGRIVHHLKHNLWRPECHVFFVGFQGYGTLGRRLVDGEKVVRIAGEEVAVKAAFHTINGFSAHGDRGDLLSWAGNFKSASTFLVTHGEPKSSEALAAGLRDQGKSAIVPKLREEIDLLARSRVELPQSACATSEADRQEALKLLQLITSEAILIRDELEECEDFRVVLPLLKSTQALISSIDVARQASPHGESTRKTA